MKKIIFGALLLVLAAPTVAVAAPRCVLNVSSPALTQLPIPIHKGSIRMGVWGFEHIPMDNLQGVTMYNSPAEWPFVSYQGHWDWETFHVGPQTGPIRGHVHLELCFPYWGEIIGAVTIPFREQIFHHDGGLTGLSGPLVRDVVWETFSPLFPAGDPNGVVVATGHLTLDPFMKPFVNSNVHGAAIKGWTNFNVGTQFNLTNGDTFGLEAWMPIYTRLSEDWPEQLDFTPTLAARSFVQSARDPEQNQWGISVMSTDEPLPLLAPFDTVWPVPTMSGYSYGGVGPGLQNGVIEMRKDMDLHNGFAGLPLNLTGDYFDPVEIGTGTHKVAMIWQTTSGPFGIPGSAAPNQTLASLLVVNVEVGPFTTPPPPTTCQDPTATNVGGFLPCTFPPPPPPPPPTSVWTTIFPTWERFGTEDRYRLCLVGHCVELVVR